MHIFPLYLTLFPLNYLFGTYVSKDWRLKHHFLIYLWVYFVDIFHLCTNSRLHKLCIPKDIIAFYTSILITVWLHWNLYHGLRTNFRNTIFMNFGRFYAFWQVLYIIYKQSGYYCILILFFCNLSYIYIYKLLKLAWIRCVSRFKMALHFFWNFKS